MLASIIIPVFNEEKYIGQAINSCLNQINITKNHVEIIVCDGRSTDDTTVVVKDLMRNHCQIKLIKNNDKFMPHGFNKALSITKGKYVMVMSGHSTLESDYIYNCLEIISKYDAKCVSGVMDTIQSNYVGKIISLALSTRFGVGNSDFRTKINSGKYVKTGVFGFYSSEIFMEIGGMDEELVKNQDEEFNFRLIKSGHKIWLDPLIKSKYYSRGNFQKLIKQYFFYGLYKIRVFQKIKTVPSIRQLVPVSFVFSIIGMLMHYYANNDPLPIITLLSIYFSTNILFSSYEILSRNKGLYNIFPLFYTYMVIHISYGIGNIIGLFYFMDKWFSNKTIDNNFNRDEFFKNRQ